jgi:subtilisin family serine protease
VRKPIERLAASSFVELARQKLSPVVVAVLDSGVNAKHPALSGRVRSQWVVEDTPRGPRVRRLRRLADNDVSGHGTCVAGMVAQTAPNAEIVDVRVLDVHALGSARTLLAGFRWAVLHGVRVVNLSLACKAEYAAELHDICEMAYERNALVVAARRNMPLVDDGFPAQLSSCVSVDAGRFGTNHEVAYAPRGRIEFVGNGVDVTTPSAKGGTQVCTGTSFATPQVAGLCALLAGARPDLRPFEVKTLLKRMGRDAAPPPK